MSGKMQLRMSYNAQLVNSDLQRCKLQGQLFNVGEKNTKTNNKYNKFMHILVDLVEMYAKLQNNSTAVITNELIFQIKRVP